MKSRFKPGSHLKMMRPSSFLSHSHELFSFKCVTSGSWNKKKIKIERKRERYGENNQMIGNKNAKLKSRIFFKKKNSVTSFDE